MKKRLFLILLLIIFIPLSTTSCIVRERITCGDFVYRTYKKNKKTVAEIISLSDAGIEKKILIIPKYLDGYEVYRTSDRYGRERGIFGEGFTKKIYLTFKLDEFEVANFSLQNVLFIGEGLLNTENYSYGAFRAFLPYNIYISPENYQDGVYHANVTYIVDGEIYWIDLCENGPIEYIPSEPIKEGYTFEGWYKDEEYQTKWDFLNDTLAPVEEIKHETGWLTYWTEVVYEEIKLYAKFDSLT